MSSTEQSVAGAAAFEGSGSSTGNGGLVNRMRDSAASQLTAQKDRATDQLGSVARAVRSSTRQLREQHHDTAAGYVDQIADQIERLSQGLRQRNLTELLDDAQRLARRQPAVFIASAFALGLVAARFLKSSSPDENVASPGGRRGRVSAPSVSGSRSGMSGSAVDMSGTDPLSGSVAPASGSAAPVSGAGSSTTRGTASSVDADTGGGMWPPRGGQTERP
jgi:hypothetical protein